MRQIVLLLAALLAIKTSAALSQDTCAPGYESCMGRCVSGGGKGVDRCIESCQAQNSACYNKVWSVPTQITSDNKSEQPADPAARDEQPTPAAARQQQR